MAEDIFPSATTLVRGLVDQEKSRAEVLHYVMSVYQRPLGLYFRGTSYRSLGEADDIVHGFFVKYLARPGYLEQWRVGDKRLRRWLANGLLLYCRDLVNERRRRRGEPLDEHEAAAPADDVSRAYETQVKVAMVRAAVERAGAACAERGLDQHWRMFERYHLRHEPLERIATDESLTPDRAWVMVRTAQRSFVKAMRAVVAADIGSEDDGEIDRELRQL